MKKQEKKNKTFLDLITMDFKKIIFGSIVLNGLFLLFGLLVYLNPYFTEKMAGILIGIYFVLSGAFDIYEYLTRRVNPLFDNRVFIGILVIILGIFTMLNPFKITKILTFTLGIYLIISAIFKGLEAFKLKKCGYDGSMLLLVISALILVFGVFVTINPMSSLYIIEAMALFIILSSILEICSLFMLYSKSKDIVKLLKD